MSEDTAQQTTQGQPPAQTAARVRRVGLLALVVFLGAGGVGQYIFLQPLPRNPRAATPREYGMDYRPVELHLDEGARGSLTLRAWYVPGARPETVVLCHGRGDAIAGLLPAVRLVHELGYTAMPIEFRAHGESGGTWSSVGAAEQRDLIAALDWLDTNAPAPVAAFGYSMGGCVALCVAARDERIRGVVTEGAVGNLPREIRRWYGPLAPPMLAAATPWIWLRAGVTPWDARPVRVIHRIAPRPVLLIHSRADRVVAFAGAERLFAAAAEPKEFWIVEEAPHVGAVLEDPKTYRRRLARFLDRVFSSAA